MPRHIFPCKNVDNILPMLRDVLGTPDAIRFENLSTKRLERSEATTWWAVCTKCVLSNLKLLVQSPNCLGLPCEWYQRYVIEPTLASLEEFLEHDSGWALSRILNLTVNVNKYNPLRARCHFKFSRELLLKRTTISVQSEDNTGFTWAVVAALHPAERDTARQSSYPHYSLMLNLGDIEFPMSVKQIAKVERQNGISVNVYSFKETEKALSIFPLRLTNQKRDRHVNLLYTPKPDHGDVGHFALIKNLSRLVSTKLSKKKAKKFICDRCLHCFGSAEKLETHAVDCGKMNDCAIRLPSEGDNLLNFGNHGRKERVKRLWEKFVQIDEQRGIR
ncbi:uncharacterized protein LOC143376874 [Andrena cerasifolii]|uniref:uncharacterized protein LOC143376874 n=1 Tax=Andrena cerasifolii TaxID=2819439 RepID=UPI004038233C